MKSVIKRLVLTLPCICLPLYAAPKAKDVFKLDQKILFQDDFQSGSVTRWGISEDDRYNLAANTPARLDVVDAPGLAGKKAVRFFVPRAPDSFRAEISLPHEQGFQERWYAGRILIPKDWVIERHSKGNDIVMQWHAIPGKGKATFPNLEISVGGDSWYIRRSFGTALENPTRSNDKLADPIQPGTWVSWVLHAKWSPKEDGLIRIWKDGKVVYEKTGPNVYGDIGVEYTPYLKSGIYHPEWHLDKDRKRAAFEADKPDALSKTIYGTDYRVASGAATYEEVAPK
ncbi:polysaccharide lyase [Luteolibacter ambystomatis]|uniref:Polysaccharide lyase n=1 Tax=Luteolibacter ambystomatis TaxID=2824561 RepID=A0A975PGS6_9BACT|nr:polysaccharide lyase [Luteolibacter ambystomatis]QUE52602.1 polysaccharide lyase [Luteolibacter ambystomatis]